MIFLLRIIKRCRVATRFLAYATVLSGLTVIQAGVVASQDTSAIAAYEQGIRLIEENDIRGLGDKLMYEKGIEKLELALQLDPEFVDAMMALAKAYWNYQLFYPDSEPKKASLRDQSESLYKKIIQIKPDFAEAYAALSVAAKESSEKISLLKKAAELDPKSKRTHGLLAQLLLSQGDIGEAVKEYRIHLKNNPESNIQTAYAHTAFANSLAKLGETKEAVEIYNGVLDLIHTESLFQRCSIVRDINLERFNSHKNFVVRVRKLNRYCTNLDHYNEAIRLINEKKYAKAIEQLNRQLKVNPYPEGTYVALEDIYLRQGESKRALEVVKSYFLIHKDPDVRCKYLKRLNVQPYRLLDKQFITHLEKECVTDKFNLRNTNVRFN